MNHTKMRERMFELDDHIGEVMCNAETISEIHHLISLLVQEFFDYGLDLEDEMKKREKAKFSHSHIRAKLRVVEKLLYKTANDLQEKSEKSSDVSELLTNEIQKAYSLSKPSTS